MNPFLVSILGSIVAVIFGVSFGRLLQIKLKNWKTNQVPPLPLASTLTVLTWILTFSGLTIFFTAVLQVYDFSYKSAFWASFFIALLSGLFMWYIVRDLLMQVQSGTIREIDRYL